MSTFLLDDVRRYARAAGATTGLSARTMLAESQQRATRSRTHFDIFMSHAFHDAEIVLGAKLKLENFYHYSVYVDWIDDPALNRTTVSKETAVALKSRMLSCASLFFAVTPESPQSKWMPWECGFFDGKVGRTAILPITPGSAAEYKGQEYLGIYPYITEAKESSTGLMALWVNNALNEYCKFDSWLNGAQPSKRD